VNGIADAAGRLGELHRGNKFTVMNRNCAIYGIVSGDCEVTLNGIYAGKKPAKRGTIIKI